MNKLSLAIVLIMMCCLMALILIQDGEISVLEARTKELEKKIAIIEVRDATLLKLFYYEGLEKP